MPSMLLATPPGIEGHEKVAFHNGSMTTFVTTWAREQFINDKSVVGRNPLQVLLQNNQFRFSNYAGF